MVHRRRSRTVFKYRPAERAVVRWAAIRPGAATSAINTSAALKNLWRHLTSSVSYITREGLLQTLYPFDINRSVSIFLKYVRYKNY